MDYIKKELNNVHQRLRESNEDLILTGFRPEHRMGHRMISNTEIYDRLNDDDFCFEDFYSDLAIRQIDLCTRWIMSVDRIKEFNMNVTSYAYKHYVEKCFNMGIHIYSGAFIVSALILEIPYKKVSLCSRQCCFPFSKRSIKMKRMAN